MKLFKAPALFFCLLIGGMTTAGFGQAPVNALAVLPTATPMQAKLTRNLTARALDSAGFASTPVQLKKGATYDVLKQSKFDTMLDVGGQQVMVSTHELIVTPKGPVVAVTVVGFTPGTIFLESARYSLDGNQDRNVKNSLKKLIPEGVITAPVEIIVTDALSTAAQDQGDTLQGTIVTSGNTSTVFVRGTPRNVLTVVYTFNGQRFTKQVPEGSKLVLP